MGLVWVQEQSDQTLQCKLATTSVIP